MEWINVKDRIPEEGLEVLTYNSDGIVVDYIIKLSLLDDPYIWARTLADDCLKVTHWMPLPEPPEE